MGVFESDYTYGGVDPSQIGLEITKSDDGGDAGGTETEVTKAVSAELKTAIGEVVKWMNKMSKGPGAPTDAIKSVAAFLGKVASGSYPSPQPTKKSADGDDGDGGNDVDISKADGETVEMTKARHAFEVTAQKAGKGKKDEDEEAMTKRHAAELADTEKVCKTKEKAAKPDEEGDEYPKPGTKKADAKKSADGGEAEGDPEDQPMVVIKRDGSVHVAGQTVQKARSFTNARTEVLSSVVGSLAKLLGDVDDDALKKALGNLSKGNLPNNATVDSQVRPTGVSKSADGDEGEANAIVEAIGKALEPVTKRLDEIEKTRNPSKSVEGEGGSDQQQTQVEKSFWHGVL